MKLKIGEAYYLDKPESYHNFGREDFYTSMRSSSIGILKKVEIELSGNKVAILKRIHKAKIHGSIFTADPKDLKIAKYTGVRPHRCRKCGRLISRSDIRFKKKDKYKGYCDWCVPTQGSLKLL